MLRAAFEYPFRGERGYERLAIGGGLLLLSAFLPVVPAVFAAGYLVRALGSVAAGGRSAIETRTPPGFEDPLSLFRSGLGAVAIGGTYLLVPATVLAVTLAGARRAGVDVAASGTAVGALAGAAAALGLAVAFAYPFPAALAGYATRGRLRAAFDRELLARAVTDGRYLTSWLAAVATLGVAAAAFAPLNVVALGFFVAFYAGMVAAALAGAGAGPAVRTTAGSADENGSESEGDPNADPDAEGEAELDESRGRSNAGD